MGKNNGTAYGLYFFWNKRRVYEYVYLYYPCMHSMSSTKKESLMEEYYTSADFHFLLLAWSFTIKSSLITLLSTFHIHTFLGGRPTGFQFHLKHPVPEIQHYSVAETMLESVRFPVRFYLQLGIISWKITKYYKVVGLRCFILSQITWYLWMFQFHKYLTRQNWSSCSGNLPFWQ